MDETEKHYKEVIDSVQKLFDDKRFEVGNLEDADKFAESRKADKYWTICFPGEFGQNVTETWSEEQILKSYYTYWVGKMIQANKHDLISNERCIEDWCTVHWAQETDKYGCPV